MEQQFSGGKPESGSLLPWEWWSWYFWGFISPWFISKKQPISVPCAKGFLNLLSGKPFLLPIHQEPGVWCARAATKKVTAWKPIPRNQPRSRKYRTRSGKNTATLKSISIKRKERILPKKLKPNKQKGFGGVLHFHYSFCFLGVSLRQRLRAGLVRVPRHKALYSSASLRNALRAPSPSLTQQAGEFSKTNLAGGNIPWVVAKMDCL